MPSHYHGASIYDPGHTHGGTFADGGSLVGTPGGSFNVISTHYSGVANAFTGVRVNSSNGLDTTASTGGGNPFSIVDPMLLATVYLKL